MSVRPAVRSLIHLAGPAALLAALALTGCGRIHGEHQVFVTMADNVFSPREMRVPVGAKVHFRNLGGALHDAVAVNGAWSTVAADGTPMGTGQWVEVAFDSAGVYPFYCPYHATPDGSQGMIGVMVVGDVDYVAGGKTDRLPVVEQPTGVTRQVPSEYATIQSAVDAASPGDLVLIAEGVYHEEVYVTTPSLVIRGADRNRTILDGEFQRANGFLVFADAVAIENLTARHYTLNGFLWSGVTGYRGSYINAINNGDYGVYTFESYDGVLDHAYGSGSPDAGFYIGGCYPCRVILDSVLAERNSGGYSGTNSGGDTYIVNSIFRDNSGSGISPNTFDVEPHPPQRETTMIGNVITGNGTGVAVAGGQRNIIERNLIQGNRTGIMLLAVRDQRYYPSTDNVVRDNVILESSRIDIAMSGIGNVGNCFEGNVHRSTRPWGLQLLQGCDGLRASVVGDLHAYFRSLAGRVALFQSTHTPANTTWWREVPHPGPQPLMPGGADAPVRPAVRPFAGYAIDLAAIRTPLDDLPADVIARLAGRD